MGRLILWVLREYDEIDPIILSGEFGAEITLNQDAQPLVGLLVFDTWKKAEDVCCFKTCMCFTVALFIVCLRLFPFSVNEEDEVTIKDAVHMIADTLDFKGKIEVSFRCSQVIVDPK